MPEPPSILRFSRLAFFSLVLILLCGAALRLVSLPHEALEGDEIFSRNVILLSPVKEIAAIRDDLVHPPLYYLALQANTKVWGASPTGIRIFSLLCGIASIGIIALVGRSLPHSRFTSLLAATLLALNQISIFYSQEARSYAWYTLLVLLFLLWIGKITRLDGEPPNAIHWALTTVLMSLIVYTHYVGTIYIGCAVFAIALALIPLTRRIAVFVCAVIAAVSFLPWLIAISTVYVQKRGIGNNLDWQGHPSAYALKQIFASALGILNIRGGTSLDLLVIVLLISTILLSERWQRLRKSPVLLTLLFLSILPPLLVFLFSRPPFNLPIFGLRHLLPSVALLILLCSYGVDCLAQRARSHPILVFSVCSALLISLTMIPTAHSILSGPNRIPYDLASKEVIKDEKAGFPAYTTWYYGIGGPVDLYCGSPCVTQLPPSDKQLPAEIVLLFGPNSHEASKQYQQLQQDGFSVIENHFYAVGGQSIYGVNLVLLKRVPAAAPASQIALNDATRSAHPEQLNLVPAKAAQLKTVKAKPL